MDYKKNEAKTLNKIAEEIVKLDETCLKLEDTKGKIKHFIEQEKAIHEIKSIIRGCKKLEHEEEKRIGDLAFDTEMLKSLEDENLKDIVKSFTKLDETLLKLDESKDSKIKSYIAQKKVLHQVKKILHKAGLFENYNTEELKDIDALVD